ncbi:CoA-acylating methylmalonate-semialdehyde dehydrogenase [Gordonia hydrophobica]|uniref:methylmalonate-semialdehyde dehydrogenase (CoA acylating) n=1 Tax=Gordonia hydrophobica TaxID=40516 RepID=A0ABZ2U587_9ACTN|nr:CoA-acylating methylmalonate-semialdehyde dehydrogenase [Gordonia hydrophobica]MBM7368704.1 malonate-semialdehyde dehydrogenase (acetylating)/methylmalonate-semialdehyde dehydrogenase [Gordonia hydrophobica]
MKPIMTMTHSHQTESDAAPTSADLPGQGGIRAPLNFVNGSDSAGTGERELTVYNPATGEVEHVFNVTTPEQVGEVVAVAKAAQKEWGESAVAHRAAVMYEVRDALRRHADELADLIVTENGKTKVDALGEVNRGLESIEFACGVADHTAGRYSRDVSKGIDVHQVREPLGVVGCITPFNFPVMVPLWMIANALSTGNAVILKPSEKSPTATTRLAEIMTEAGIPPGVFNVVQGDAATAGALIEHPDVAAISFVGSTPVAKAIYEQGTKLGKRVQALGGAKNHMVVLPDANLDDAANAAVGAAFGAAGERCMAVSVLVAVGDVADPLIEKISGLMSKLTVGPGNEGGSDFGPVISREHRDRVAGFLDASGEAGGALVVDGRKNERFEQDGYFIGPSLIDNITPGTACYDNEIFGPVLAVMRVSSLDEAIDVVNENPYGNGAALFTESGGAARRFEADTKIGMLGINVPIPVPVGWYSFGGWKSSLFGDSHMYGEEGVRFFTRAKVVTSRWKDGSK